MLLNDKYVERKLDESIRGFRHSKIWQSKRSIVSNMNELSNEQFANLSWISFSQEFTSYNDTVSFILYLLLIFKKKINNKLNYIN